MDILNHTDAQWGAAPALIRFPAAGRAPFALVLPGGSYEKADCAAATKICEELAGLGCNAFLLNYRCGKAGRAPVPAGDVADAINTLLDRADELNIDPTGYALAGIEAGAHLAACFASELGWLRFGLNRPGAVLLFSPMLTLTDTAFLNFLGEARISDPAERELWIAEDQVTRLYPKTYVQADANLPFAKALTENGIQNSFEADGSIKDAVAFWRN